MQKKVLVYSSLNIDSIFNMDHINAPGETQSSLGFKKSAGGKGANQSVALARAGSCVFFAGKAGDDGQFILDKMKKTGINTDFVFHTDSGSGQAIIQLDKNGQNSIILYGGGNLQIEKSEIDKVFDNFDEGDVLVVDGEINNTKYIVEQAVAKKMYICMNPSPINEEVLGLDINKASLIIVNEIEGSILSGVNQDKYEDVCKALSKKYPKTEVVVTAGSQGSYYCYNNELVFTPSCKVKVVDTVGAGDTFLGYFVSERLRGTPIKTCMEIASKAASITCSRPGALDSIPVISEVK